MSRRNAIDYAPVTASTDDPGGGGGGRRPSRTNLSAGTDADRKQRTNIPSLVCAILASMTTGGTTYAFGLYGADLKKSLKLSPGELDTISTAFFFAGLFSWIPGLLVDTFGTRLGMALGGWTGAASLCVYWLVSKQIWSMEHESLVPVLSMLGIMIFLSCAMVTGSVFKILVAACGPGTKGSAVGVAKGYVGLGAGAYACIFEAMRAPHQSHLDFMPMAAFFFLLCAVTPALVLLPTQQQLQHDVFEDEATTLHFRVLYASLSAMAVLVMGSSMLALSDGKESHRNYFLGFLIVAVWIGPILSLLSLPRARHQQNIEGRLEDPRLDDDSQDPLSVSNSSTRSQGRGDISMLKMKRGGDDADTVSRDRISDGEEDEALLETAGESSHHGSHQDNSDPVSEENLNLTQMLRTPSALLMLWTTTMLVGAGTVETNNMGQMVEAMGFPDTVTSASLAFFSVAQAGSRVATGAISESALNWNTKVFGLEKGIPRPFFFIVAALVAFAGHGMLSLAKHVFGFVLGVTLSGAAFGMVWPLMVLVTGEVFGTANASANYMFFDGFTSAVGTLLLTKGLAQHVCKL